MKNKKWIKLLGPSVSNKELEAVKKVLKSGWWGLGPITEELEREFAEFAGTKYAIALNSATSALHLSVKVLNKKGKIITPAFTFISTAIAGLYEGCSIEFADIDEKTYCLDPEDVNRKADHRTIAVIPVHYAGVLAKMEYDLQNIVVIEDCAHAAGTINAGKSGLMSCWSFHAVKNIAAGDGGMITTNNKELAERLRRLRWLGINYSTHEREKRGYNWEYSVDEIGYKYHANDIQSAIALEQLRRIDLLNAKREKIAERYTKALGSLPIILPQQSDSWHLYVIRTEKKHRNKLIDHLRQKNISVGVHYKPLYYYPIFNISQAEAKKRLPVTEKIWQEVISLPIYPDLTDMEQDTIIKHIKNYFY